MVFFLWLEPIKSHFDSKYSFVNIQVGIYLKSLECLSIKTLEPVFITSSSLPNAPPSHSHFVSCPRYNKDGCDYRKLWPRWHKEPYSGQHPDSPTRDIRSKSVYFGSLLRYSVYRFEVNSWIEMTLTHTKSLVKSSFVNSHVLVGSCRLLTQRDIIAPDPSSQWNMMVAFRTPLMY